MLGFCVYGMYCSFFLGVYLGLKELILRLVRGYLECGCYFWDLYYRKGLRYFGGLNRIGRFRNWILGGSVYRMENLGFYFYV